MKKPQDMELEEFLIYFKKKHFKGLTNMSKTAEFDLLEDWFVNKIGKIVFIELYENTKPPKEKGAKRMGINTRGALSGYWKTS